MLENLFDLKQSLSTNNIIFSFCGPMSQKALEGIGATIKSALEKDNVNPTISTKVFAIFVEQVQNVIHYSAEKITKSDDVEYELSLGIVMIGNDNDRYFIVGGNKISKSQAQKIDTMLKTLKSMNKDELKEYYKKKRRENSDEDSKGAGLGFLEMARKSSEPLEYLIRDIDEDYSFFSIKVIV